MNKITGGLANALVMLEGEYSTALGGKLSHIWAAASCKILHFRKDYTAWVFRTTTLFHRPVRTAMIYLRCL